ncbi:MAG: iron transporter [Propionivibrio sp.]
MFARITRTALCTIGLLAIAAHISPRPAEAAEFKLANKPGERIVRQQMTVEASYMQPIELEGHRENLPREQADAYFVAHLKAASAHPHGYSKFAWIPFLNVSYTLEKLDSDWKREGRLNAAIAKFGPHYGANVKLDGVGKYRYTVHVAPPSSGAEGGIDRLVDRENGISWWAPFDASWTFTYLGIGKIGTIGAKGGY